MVRGEESEFFSQTLYGTAIYAYIGVVWGVNVGIYGIHGVSGSQTLEVDPSLPHCDMGRWGDGHESSPHMVRCHA